MNIRFRQSEFSVQELRTEHIDGILELMNQEGWYYYDRRELQRYITLNEDCFTLLKSGRVAGTLFTTNYGNQIWIGNIVIEHASRGNGLASQLIQSTMDTLREQNGNHTFRLGSVPLAIGLYKKAGFHPEAFNTAQEADLPLEANLPPVSLNDRLQIEPIREQNLEAIGRLDERFFRSNRLPLLRKLYQDSIPDGCLCLIDQGAMAGFLMVRRRQATKVEGRFAEGPDAVYRLGPCCVLPEVGINGFKALFQKAIPVINRHALAHEGQAKIYAVFPRNADRENIYRDTRKLARAMKIDPDMDLDAVYDEHEQLFKGPTSTKNEAQWTYMKQLGFRPEYFEQIMSCTPADSTEETKGDPEGIFATATPGDKA